MCPLPPLTYLTQSSGYPDSWGIGTVSILQMRVLRHEDAK